MPSSFNEPYIVGGYSDSEKMYCFFSSAKKRAALAESKNAVDFQLATGSFPLKNFRRLYFSNLDIGHIAVMEEESGGLRIVVSKDFKKWKTLCRLNSLDYNNGAIVPNYQINGDYIMYLGGKRLRIGSSHNGKKWQLDKYQHPDIPINDNEEIKVDFVDKLPRGNFLCYRIIRKENEILHHQVHIALFDEAFPDRLIWRSTNPIWQEESYQSEQDNELGSNFGAAFIFRSQLFGFWNHSNGEINLVRYPLLDIPFELPRDQTLSLTKANANPIIFPRDNYPWEAFATYNPAALNVEGRVHILYRAQGHDLISSIGYASSADGINIDERLDAPIYYPQEVFDSFQKTSPSEVAQQYVSGGGIAGCEDPRVTLIDNRVYMTYVAFDGASPPRAALTSIHLDDFLAKRWLWQRPVLISPPGIVDKSAVIFPEKINNKYVIMHRIFPNILIDYEADLNFDGTRWLRGLHSINIREGMWDSRKIGAGAPPLKTKEGWLLIYYGVDDRDDRFYKIGAMLLDLENPSKVLYRSDSPILEPETWYENSGFKPGVAYPCGAVILNDQLLVYYGGADCVVCVASSNLENFLQALKANHEFKLLPKKMQFNLNANSKKQKIFIKENQRIKNHAAHSTQTQSDNFA